jgi:membrane-associated phospholipid phosphatase
MTPCWYHRSGMPDSYPDRLGTGNLVTRVGRADRRLGLRLGLALIATLGLGVPFTLLAVLVRAEWDPLIRLDTSVAEGLNRVALRNDWLVHTLEAVSFVIGPFVLRPVVTLVALWLLVRERRVRLAGWVLVAIWGSALLTVVLKEVVDRARPDLVDAVSTAGGRSFPSGHALGGTVACGLLVLVLGPLLPRRWRPAAWVAAGLAVLAVCFARVGLGVHYVTDVTAGVVLAVAWLAVTSAVFEWWRRDVGLPPAPATEAEPELGEGVPEPRAG